MHDRLRFALQKRITPSHTYATVPLSRERHKECRRQTESRHALERGVRRAPFELRLLTFLRAAAALAGFRAVGFRAPAFAGLKPPTAFLILLRVSCQPFQLRSKTMPFGSLNLRSKPSSSGS